MSEAASSVDRKHGKAPRGAHRWLLRIAVALLVLLALAAALTYAAFKTEFGARTLWHTALRALPGKLAGDVVGGTVADGLQLRNVVYRDKAREVKADRIDARWDWSRSPLALTIDHLRIGRLDYTAFPAPKQPPSLPDRLTVPLAIDLRSATLQTLALHSDGGTTEINDIALHGKTDGTHHALTLEHANTPYGSAHVQLQLDGTRPFATHGAANLAGAWQGERYRLDVGLSGSLQALGVQLQATGGRLTGHAQIAATPFAAIPLQRAQVTLRKLNPQAFSASLPKAELDLDANLAPTANEQTQQDVSQLEVAGRVSVHNAQAGPLDRKLLPIVSAKADVRLTTQQQQLQRLQAGLTGGATLSGSGQLNTGNGRFELQAKDLDLHALYGKLQPTKLDGPLTVELDGNTQHIALDLTGPSLAIAANADLNPQQIALNDAVLQAGDAQLKLSGTLGRGEKQAFAAHGTLNDFNPSRFLASPKVADGRINMQFDARGTLQPEPDARLQFDIRDSSYAGLPMTGGGRLQLAGKKLSAGDTRLSIAGNRVQLAGSFGNPGERLKFSIDAPALARLGLGVSGLLQAEGELGGSIARPTVDARYRAEQLAYGQYRLAQLSGQVRTNGVPGRNPDARVTLELTAGGAQAPEVSLSSLHASVDGSYASHLLSLDADGRLRGQPLALNLSAQGRLDERPQGYAWDGTLRTLENRGFPRLKLADPLPVSVAPQKVVLGATRVSLEQAQIDLKSLRFDDQVISSEGSFNALDVRHLLELRRELIGAEAPVNTDLVLDGSWNLALADSAGGYFQVERRSGDVRMLGTVRDSALGINALRLRGDLRGNSIILSAEAAARRLGSANGTAQLALQPSGGRLMPQPDSALAGHITAAVPRLQNIASMAGPKVALDGSVGIDLSLSGTLAEPVLSGDISGKSLALALYDQGVRLHDGTAQIHIADNVADIRQLVFHGGDGTVGATGRIPLDHPEGMTADIVADHLQLLSSPSGQMTVSGRADAGNVDNQLQIAGKFTVDLARFRLPEKSAPKLGDDVHVIRGTRQQAAARPQEAAKPAAEREAGPFTPRVRVLLDLGDDFRFEGSGADLLLAGAVTIVSAPGETPQANGTVRIVDGTYEAFGAKLAIERGVINFQGPLANPNIDILAMRREQDVAAGVHMTGTVNRPRVQLVSEPDVPEQEKLNWLVFGRSGSSSTADAGPAQAQTAAKSAALGLLNKFGGARIAKGFGLDQLAIGNSEFGLGSQQVVSLGKEISNRLTIGYEQSLAGAEGVLKLTYDLSRHWSFVVRGGTIGGLDVLYSKRFDHFGGAGERR